MAWGAKSQPPIIISRLFETLPGDEFMAFGYCRGRNEDDSTAFLDSDCRRLDEPAAAGGDRVIEGGEPGFAYAAGWQEGAVCQRAAPVAWREWQGGRAEDSARTGKLQLWRRVSRRRWHGGKGLWVALMLACASLVGGLSGCSRYLPLQSLAAAMPFRSSA